MGSLFFKMMMVLNLNLFNSLETSFEGDSRTLKQLDDQHLLCKLKPTVFSLAAGGPVEVEGIDVVRAELNALLCEELHRYGIKTSTVKTENGLILMKKEKVPPIEVVVKGALIGSPKHIYEGIQTTATRNGEPLDKRHPPYVRFDWRNPLPKEDACMPEGLCNHFIDVNKAKETALDAFERLRCIFLRHDLELLDICFFMNENGDTICAEVSTDNVRLQYVGLDPSLAEIFSSREPEFATRRAEEVLKLLQTPKLKYPKIIFSGGFCAGKTSLINLLQTRLGIPKLIDHTTRAMRPGEREGSPYHFISREEFEEKLKNDFYFEWVEFNNNYYGVPKSDVFEKESWALDILSKAWVDYNGIVPGVVGIFIESPSDEIIIERARARGDSEEKIKERLLAAKEESSEGFDLVIPADTTLDEKYQMIKEFICE